MSVVDEVRDLADSVARRRSLRLWDIEVGGQPGRQIVRVLVDADDGIDLDTVAEVAEEISRALDLKDPIQGRYTLEVSSPGIERTLRTPEHFRLSVGDKVTVKTREVMVGNSHRVDGTIAEATPGEVKLSLDEGEVILPYDAIKSARTVFEWK